MVCYTYLLISSQSSCMLFMLFPSPQGQWTVWDHFELHVQCHTVCDRPSPSRHKQHRILRLLPRDWQWLQRLEALQQQWCLWLVNWYDKIKLMKLGVQLWSLES
jgi:hypothetical protein